MKNFIFFMIFIWIIFSGCANVQHCFKFEGEKSGFSGELEYCINRGESNNNGTPVFNNGGDKMILINESFLERALGDDISAKKNTTTYQKFIEKFGK